MIDLVERELRAVDWASCSAAVAGDADRIPMAIRALVASRSPAAAEDAYWRLDNHVVVQGQLFEAALPLVPVALAALSGELPPHARLRMLDLLVEIVSGGPHESEVRAGRATLGTACRSAARAGLWLFYAQLPAADAPSRERLLQIIYAVDDDRTRASTLLTHLAAADPDTRVRNAAAEFLGQMPGVIFDELNPS